MDRNTDFSIRFHVAEAGAARASIEGTATAMDRSAESADRLAASLGRLGSAKIGSQKRVAEAKEEARELKALEKELADFAKTFEEEKTASVEEESAKRIQFAKSEEDARMRAVKIGTQIQKAEEKEVTDNAKREATERKAVEKSLFDFLDRTEKNSVLQQETLERQKTAIFKAENDKRIRFATAASMGAGTSGIGPMASAPVYASMIGGSRPTNVGPGGSRGAINALQIDKDWDAAIGMNRMFDARKLRVNVAKQMDAVGLAITDVLAGWKDKSLTAAQGMGILSGKLGGLSAALYDTYRKFEGIYKSLTAIRVGAFNTLMASAPVVAGGVGLAMSAGTFEMRKRAISHQLGSDDKGADFVEQLRKFDIESGSVTDLNTTLELGQTMLGAKFKPEELLNKQGTGLFTVVADILGRMGKGKVEFEAVMNQIVQSHHASFNSRDLRAMRESGGLPIVDILNEGLGEKRTSDAMNGGKPLSYDEFTQGLIKGGTSKKLGYVGGAAVTTETLPGQIANLQSALQNLAITIGDTLMPQVKSVVAGFSAIANKISEWHKGPFGFLLKAVDHAIFGFSLLTTGIALFLIPLTIFLQLILDIVASWDALVLLFGFLGKALTVWLPDALLGAAEVLADFILAVASIPLAVGLAAIAIYHWRDAIADWVTDTEDRIYNLFHPLTPRVVGKEARQKLSDETNFKMYQTDVKGGRFAGTYDQYKAKLQNSYNSYGSEGDKVATEANTAATKENTAQGKGIVSALDKMKKDVLSAKEYLASSGEGGGSLGGTAEQIYQLRRAGKFGDKDATKAAGIMSLDLTHAKSVQAGIDKLKKESDRKDALEQIKGLGNGSDDVENIDDLEEQLRAANRVKDRATALVLSERLFRAKKAESKEHQEEREDKKEARHIEQVKDQVFKDRLTAFRAYAKALVKSGKATSETALAAINLLRENHEHEKLGMPSEAGGDKVNALISGFGRKQSKAAIIPNLIAELHNALEAGYGSIADALKVRIAQAKLLAGQYGPNATASYGSGGKRIAIGAGSAIAPLLENFGATGTSFGAGSLSFAYGNEFLADTGNINRAPGSPALKVPGMRSIMPPGVMERKRIGAGGAGGGGNPVMEMQWPPTDVRVNNSGDVDVILREHRFTIPGNGNAQAAGWG